MLPSDPIVLLGTLVPMLGIMEMGVTAVAGRLSVPAAGNPRTQWWRKLSFEEEVFQRNANS